MSVMYKIVIKVIANRIKGCFLSLVGPYQTCFIPSRRIIDNIIIVEEVIHSMRVKKGSKGFLVLKVDLEKAYDKIRWDFLQDILSEVGLLTNLIRVIMNCVSSISM